MNNQDIEKLEKRLENTERALHGFWTLLEDVLSPREQESIGRMMSDYFHANHALETKAFDSPDFKS